ncbi:bifunctional metallophosphatase/5'-nucleotidase [Paraglaciecola aestuariivivens]
MPDISNTSNGSYSDLAEVLNKLRSQPDSTLFAFTGGSLGPSPLSSLDRGSHIIDILNTLEPDLMTLTKREFSYYEDELTLRTYEAAFPIVTGNLYDPLINSNLEGVLSSIVIEKQNMQIGFIAILDEEVVEEYLLKRVDVFEPQQIINRQITQLKQKGAELIILVYSKDRDYYQTLLAEQKIDLALQVSPISADPLLHQESNNIFTVSYDNPITVLKLVWQGNTAKNNLVVEQQDISLDKLSHQSDTAKLVTEYEQRLNRLLEQKIGVLNTTINTDRERIRTEEMPFGNFIADTMKNFAKADVGLINSGVIRGNKSYAQGTAITRRDIASELPFRTYLAVVQITGAQLKQALENSVSAVETAKGRFLQVSGLSFSYSLNNPIGQRTQNILVNGQPLNLTQTYTVATSNYIANGGDGFDMLTNATKVELSSQAAPLISDLIIRAIQRQKHLAPKLDNRIKRID